MSEPKRVTFTTLSSSVSSTIVGGSCAAGFFGNSSSSGNSVPASVVAVAAAAAAAAATTTTTSSTSLRFGGGAERGATDERKGGNKTLRLTLELFPTDSCSYPEFNYSKLMHLEKKKLKKIKQKSNGFADPFNNDMNDDDVARIARDLEKKYGTTYASGRGRSKKDDHCDIGLGYDESDSFIDNTEAYDEIIPEEVETVEGGFYINCGALEFKKLHTESTTTKTDEIIKMPNRPRKRVISSSSSEDSSSSGEEVEEDVESEGEVSSADTGKGSKNGNNTGPTATIGTTSDKRPRTNSTTNVPNNNKRSKTQEQELKKTKNNKAIGIGGSSTSNSPKPSSVGSDSEKERVRQKTIKTTTVKDMLKAKRDNFLKMQEVSGVVGGGALEVKPVNGELKGATSKSSEDESSTSDDSDGTSEDSDTNDSVPPHEKKGKKPVNTEENNEKLRSADTKLPDLEAEIVTEISQFKEIVKTKNMTGKRFQFDEQLTEMLLKIDESLLCVEKAQRNMVFAHLEYNLLLPKYFFLRKAKQLRIKEEKLKSKRALGKLRKCVIETMPGAIANFEVELRKHAELQAGNVNAEHPPKMPKKKFPWNNNLRTLLYEVYQVRWTSYPVLGTRKETLEDFINVFLREKVVDIWPSGWMRFEELQREIEKRKSAAKKAKDKKKGKDVDSAGNAPSTAGPSSLLGNAHAVAGAGAMNSGNAFMKQFEEFATGSRSSCANSDTESVASSSASASNGLKRKGSDVGKQAGNKGKVSKTNAGNAIGNVADRNILKQQQQQQQHPQQQQTSVFNAVPTSQELHIYSKKTELNAQSTLTSATAQISAVPTAALTISAPGPPTLTPPMKHSKSGERERDSNVRVIDLDNYRSTTDILLSSQQLLRPMAPTTTSTVSTIRTEAGAANVPNPAYRRDSSSESDGVEIVSVYQVKPLIGTPGKQKYKKNATATSMSTAPLYSQESAQLIQYASAPSNIASNNNNSNASNNNSKKIDPLSGVNSANNFDALQVVRTLKDLGLQQQQQQLQQQQLQQQQQQLQQKSPLSAPHNASKKDHCAQ